MKIAVKKFFITILTTFLLAVFLFFPFLTKGETEINLSVAPETFELEVKRGDMLSKKINILNKSEVPIPIEATVSNFGSEEYSGKINFFEDSTKRVGTEDDISFNPRKWIQIENPDFILDSKQTKEVDFSIKVPENVEPGGHYAVILFEPKLPSYYFEPEAALKTIPKIGVLFLFSVEVEGVKKSETPLIVSEFSIPEQFHLRGLENLAGLISKTFAAENKTFSIVEKSELPFSLSLKNDDIYHIKPGGSLTILNQSGNIVGETEIKEITILPSMTREIPVDFKPNLPKNLIKYLPAWASKLISQNILFGKYKALLYLKVGNDIINKDIYFWVFPWKIFFSTAFIACVLLIILIKYRKRFKLAILVLFGKKNQTT